MKKRILLLIGLLGLVLFPVFGQDVPVPTDWQDLYANYGQFFANYLGVAGIAMFLGALLIRIFNAEKRIVKIVIIWALAIAVSFVGMLVHIGYLAEAAWWEALLWGALSGLVANGIWSTNTAFLKTIVEFLINLIKSKPAKE